MKVVKGIFCLAKSPCLWFQKFSNILQEQGFQESRIIKCLFVKFKNVAGRVVAQALVALHVDDAMLAGDNTCAFLMGGAEVKAFLFANGRPSATSPFSFAVGSYTECQTRRSSRTLTSMRRLSTA